MNNGWTRTTLGELCDGGLGMIQTGPFGSQLHSYDYEPTGIPVVPTEAIRRRRIHEESLPRVSEATADRLARHRLKAGDILFARRGVQATGLSALVESKHEGWLCGTGAILLRLTTSEVDSTFLSFVLSSDAAISWLKAHAVGAVMPNLNEGVLRRLPLLLPPLKHQRAIAHMLGALDDKIELNRRMNETLEAMAQALFKECFVEAMKNGLPEGWTEAPLDTIAHFLNGLALQKFPPNSEHSLPVIKIAQLRRGTTEGADRANVNFASEYIIQDGDVLFSWSGSLEVLLWCGGRGALNQHLFKVTSSKYPKWFYYLWTRYHLPEFQRIASAKATTMGHIQRHHLSEAEVLIPPDDQLKGMDAKIAPLIEKIIGNNIESRTLAALREALLPKLMSGEVRVRRAVVSEP